MTSGARAVPIFLLSVFWLMPHTLAATMVPETIRGTTTTQEGTVLLPGVEVTVTDVTSGRRMAVVVSDGTGRFRVDGLPPGRYRLRTHLAGFSDVTTDVLDLPPGQALDVALDLKLGSFWERVNVVGQAGVARLETAATGEAVSGSMLDVLPIVPGSFQAVLPVLPGVVRGLDGQISVKGSRPIQSGLQVGQSSANDPSTGNFGVELPVDSVESVEMVANPYRARDGRFSSSIIKVETRSGSNEWHGTARGLLPFPCLKMCDGYSMGIRHYEPRLWLGGPLLKDRLFVAQGIEDPMEPAPGRKPPGGCER